MHSVKGEYYFVTFEAGPVAALAKHQRCCLDIFFPNLGDALIVTSHVARKCRNFRQISEGWGRHSIDNGVRG